VPKRMRLLFLRQGSWRPGTGVVDENFATRMSVRFFRGDDATGTAGHGSVTGKTLSSRTRGGRETSMRKPETIVRKSPLAGRPRCRARRVALRLGASRSIATGAPDRAISPGRRRGLQCSPDRSMRLSDWDRPFSIDNRPGAGTKSDGGCRRAHTDGPYAPASQLRRTR